MQLFSAEALQLLTSLQVNIFKLFRHLDSIWIIALPLDELLNPAVIRFCVFVFFYVGKHLVEAQGLEVILGFCNCQVFSVAFVLLIVVAELCRINPRLPPEIVTILTHQVSDLDVLGLLIPLDILAMFLFFEVMFELVSVFNLLVVAHIVFVFLNTVLFLHSSNEVEHGAVFLQESERQQLQIVVAHILYFGPPIHVILAQLLLELKHHQALTSQELALLLG